MPAKSNAGWHTCRECSRRFNAGASEPLARFVGYCGVCRPRVPADYFSNVIAATAQSSGEMVVEGRLQAFNDGPDEPDYLDDLPDYGYV